MLEATVCKTASEKTEAVAWRWGLLMTHRIQQVSFGTSSSEMEETAGPFQCTRITLWGLDFLRNFQFFGVCLTIPKK